MNNFLENCIPYEDYLRMKAQAIPPHRMKEFESITCECQDEMHHCVQFPLSVHQQRNHYFCMDSTDVAGSLLELARPVPSPIQHQTGSLTATFDEPRPVQAQAQQDLYTHNQRLLILPSPETQSANFQGSSNTDERRPCSSSVAQPVKKRKFDLPTANNYTNHSLLQNTPSTVLSLPVHSQQQAYVPVHHELLTVDSSQLYVPFTTSEAGQVPTVDSWTSFSNFTPCTESQTIEQIPLPQDNRSTLEMGEIPVKVHKIKLKKGTDPLDGKKANHEEMVKTLGTSSLPMQFLNGHGDIHMPVSVQAGGRVHQPAKFWEQHERQHEAMRSSPDQLLQMKNYPDLLCTLRPEEGAYFWKTWALIKNEDLLKEYEYSKLPGFGRRKSVIFREDVLSVPIAELNYGLCLMTKDARQRDGSTFEADTLYYLFLCIQKHMFDNDRVDNIFADLYYSKFLESLHEVLKEWCPKVNPYGYTVSSCITEDMLWICKQLGAHSPTTLLFTLMFFNTKYFILETVEQHVQLGFSKITKQTKKSSGLGKNKCCTIRFLRLNGQTRAGQREETYVEQLEDPDNPLKCPIKLYDFYRFKCPQGAKGPSEAFYLVPEPVVVPNSPIWYSAQPVNEQVMEQMLTRILLVKEVQESHASSRLTVSQ